MAPSPEPGPIELLLRQVSHAMSPNDKVRAFLAQNRMSQSYFADLCQVPHSRINDLVNPKKESKLTLNLVLPIARAMGITVDELCNPKAPWPPPEGQAAVPASPGLALTEDDLEILRIARRLGADEAIARLLLSRPIILHRECDEGDRP